jgi:hypothetical protein
MLIPISIAVFTALFFIILKLTDTALTDGYCSYLLKDPKNHDSALPAKLAAAVLPRGRIFRGVSIPIPGKDGEEIHLGTVIVSRAGIFIICQINGSGILENPPDRKWKLISAGKFTEFENPFLHQKDARTLLEYYAASCVSPDVHAHSIVLYTGSQLKFTSQKPRGVMSAKELPSKLSKMEKTGRLTRDQVRAACKMLSNIEAY